MGRRSYTREQYQEGMRLLQSGYSPYEIGETLGIYWSTVYAWRRGHKPWSAKWEPKPSPELAYVLGALLGDGTVRRMHVRGRPTYVISLCVKDYEFAYEFSRCMAVVLGKPLKEPKRMGSDQRWHVKYHSKAFYEWYKLLQKDLSNLKEYVEHNKETVKGFLKGFFDAEGGFYKYPYGSRIMLTNTDLELLQYVQYLLRQYFSIYSAIYRNKCRKRVQGKRPLYTLAIYRKFSIDKFLREIGFTITRKQQGGKQHRIE